MARGRADLDTGAPGEVSVWFKPPLFGGLGQRYDSRAAVAPFPFD